MPFRARPGISAVTARRGRESPPRPFGSMIPNGSGVPHTSSADKHHRDVGERGTLGRSAPGRTCPSPQGLAREDLAPDSGAKVPVRWEHRLLAVPSGGATVAVKGSQDEWRPVAAVVRAARAVRGLCPDRNPCGAPWTGSRPWSRAGWSPSSWPGPRSPRLPPGTRSAAPAPAPPALSRPPGAGCPPCCSSPLRLRRTARTG